MGPHIHDFSPYCKWLAHRRHQSVSTAEGYSDAVDLLAQLAVLVHRQKTACAATLSITSTLHPRDILEDGEQ